MLKFLPKIILLIMKKNIIFTLFIILTSCSTNNNERENITNKMIAEVSYLASDDLEGRETGTDFRKACCRLH